MEEKGGRGPHRETWHSPSSTLATQPPMGGRVLTRHCGTPGAQAPPLSPEGHLWSLILSLSWAHGRPCVLVLQSEAPGPHVSDTTQEGLGMAGGNLP